MRCVVDASVAIKWFFQSAPDEADVDAAVALLRANRDGLADFHQPPHFIAEVAAVLARKKPDEAQADLGDLLEIDFRIIEDAAIHQTALDLAIRLNHHLFDTLYHAVALHMTGTVLVTADRRYFAKAQPIGHIILLNDLAQTAHAHRDA
ncbi:type II toxin-antitoxin system VapC family toxin [Thiobaca trueperi]|uniref:Ribonuclease VapC n=1 Tax=Thiobaca trueperi TaxID=127458 RepID=A0A4R3N2H1_9GAMM|nr:type II toxin-antitoxin system VapC family toxin [Thiobaca trueperi]TCT20869.1 putative nucleic acid-binding protein [Thiobaca trueperi]